MTRPRLVLMILALGFGAYVARTLGHGEGAAPAHMRVATSVAADPQPVRVAASPRLRGARLPRITVPALRRVRVRTAPRRVVVPRPPASAASPAGADGTWLTAASPAPAPSASAPVVAPAPAAPAPAAPVAAAPAPSAPRAPSAPSAPSAPAATPAPAPTGGSRGGAAPPSQPGPTFDSSGSGPAFDSSG